MSVVFTDVRWPAPDALFERMAAAMESHLNHSTIGGQPVGGRCLGNVNDVFRQIGGTPRFLSGSGFDQARDVAEALRAKASKTIPPRGAICLWTSTSTSASGHIAVSDGNGRSVNNWSGGTVVRTALSRQTGGYVGWVSPALLGRPPAYTPGTNPAYTGPDAGSIGGVGSSGQDQPREPLPKPPTFKARSGRSRPHLGDDTFTLNGKKFSADLEGLVVSAGLDLAVEEASQVTLTVLDPREKLLKRDLRGSRLGWDGSAWDLSACSLQAAAATLELEARSVLARRMRSTYRVVGEHKVRPDQWIPRWVTALGGVAVVQKAGRRAVLPEDTTQSVWDVLASLCSDMGWSFVEYGGKLWAGSRAWAYDGGPGLPTWQATWKTDATTDLLDAAPALTNDDPDNLGLADFTLTWNRGRRLRPWHVLTLDGMGIYDGRWLIETVQVPNDGTSPVTVSTSRPRRKAQPSDSPTSQAAPKDKKSAAYAKWFAKTLLAKYGWDGDQFGPLDKLWTRESGWRWNAENSSSGAYGIPQALPGHKMAAAGADWKSNPETQIRWGLGYIKGRYRTPARAWEHSQQNGWY